MWSKAELKILPVTFLITAIITIVLAALLKNKSNRAKTTPLAVIVLLMITAEAVKISLSIASNTFTAWQLPLHYCSAFMLWFFLSCFFTKKSRRIFYALSITTGIPMIIVLLIYPSSILRDSVDFIFNSNNFYYYHNFFYHILVILFVCLLLSLRLYKPKISDLKYVLIYFYAYAVIATIGSNIFNQNFANLLYGDYKILDNIRTAYGYFWYLLFMYVAGFIVITATFLALLFIEKLLSKKHVKDFKYIEISKNLTHKP